MSTVRTTADPPTGQKKTDAPRAPRNFWEIWPKGWGSDGESEIRFGLSTSVHPSHRPTVWSVVWLWVVSPLPGQLDANGGIMMDLVGLVGNSYH